MISRKKNIPQPSDFPEVMNQVQVALFLGISRSSVQEYTKNGTILHLKLGRRCLYSKTRVLQWVEGGGNTDS